MPPKIDYELDRHLRTDKPEIGMMTMLRSMRRQGHRPMRRKWGLREYRVQCSKCFREFWIYVDPGERKVVIPGIEKCNVVHLSEAV